MYICMYLCIHILSALHCAWIGQSMCTPILQHVQKTNSGVGSVVFMSLEWRPLWVVSCACSLVSIHSFGMKSGAKTLTCVNIPELFQSTDWLRSRFPFCSQLHSVYCPPSLSSHKWASEVHPIWELPQNSRYGRSLADKRRIKYRYVKGVSLHRLGYITVTGRFDSVNRLCAQGDGIHGSP